MSKKEITDFPSWILQQAGEREMPYNPLALILSQLEGDATPALVYVRTPYFNKASE